MRKVSQQEAARLRSTGEAGFYAVWINPVVIHPRQVYVVDIGGKYYLTDPDELKIEFVGLTQVPVPNGKVKAMHTITTTNQELGRMLQEDAARAVRLELGTEIPARHTDSIKPRPENN